MKITPKSIAAFWKRVNKQGPIPAGRPELGPCWIWTGWVRSSKSLYGIIQMDHECIKVHRFSFILHFGEPPESTPCILHHCDTPPCVNQSHLFAGTQLANIQDRNSKGRQATGVAHGFAKLNDKIVMQAIQEFSTGKFNKNQLAEKYGVSGPAMGDAILGKTWKHIAERRRLAKLERETRLAGKGMVAA